MGVHGRSAHMFASHHASSNVFNNIHAGAYMHRGRKPGTSLNGDRRVESMGGIAAGRWWGHRGRGGGVGMVRLCWVWAWGALGEKEGMCRKKEQREEVWER